MSNENTLKDYASYKTLESFKKFLLIYLDNMNDALNKNIKDVQDNLTKHLENVGTSNFVIDEDGNYTYIPVVFGLDDNGELVYDDNMFTFNVDDDGNLTWEVNK